MSINYLEISKCLNYSEKLKMIYGVLSKKEKGLEVGVDVMPFISDCIIEYPFEIKL